MEKKTFHQFSGAEDFSSHIEREKVVVEGLEVGVANYRPRIALRIYAQIKQNKQIISLLVVVFHSNCEALFRLKTT